jgi:ribonuclease HI
LTSGLVLRTDGAARGNPGPAGAGVVIEDERGNVLRELACYVGTRTNNQAEYEALVLGLRSVLEDPPRPPGAVTACLDSELVVRQLEGRYRVKDPELQALFARAARLIGRLPSFRVRHVPREENRRADRLANFAIDASAVEPPAKPGKTLASGSPRGEPRDADSGGSVSGGAA